MMELGWKAGGAHSAEAKPPRYDPLQVPMGARRDLLDRTPSGSQILDIGCASGHIGRYLATHRRAIVDGVEPEVDFAQQAARSYRRVYNSSIEEALVALLPERQHTYDAVLLLDVLEHVVDPWSVLNKCQAFLREGGKALISIPNVAHWSVRKALLLGRWAYSDFGLLDRTHLRFCTRTTVLDLLAGSGWEPTWERPSVGQPPVVKLSEAQLRLLEKWPSLFAVQFLFEAVPSDRP